MAFGYHIRELRKKQRISAEKLADLLGVDAGRLRKWEQNDSTPRHEDIERIEAAMGMTMAQIMDLDQLPSLKKVPNIKQEIPKGTDVDVIQLKAAVKTISVILARLMAKTYGRDANDCLDEIEEITRINLRELKDGP